MYDHCRFIDTHCHFDFPPFVGNEVESLQQARQSGVAGIIVPAVEASRFERVLDLSKRYPELWPALGMHPVFITRHDEQGIEQLRYHVKQSCTELIAIGEIGLDLWIDNPCFERQQTLLDQQLRLAHDYDLPVILHSRRTHDLLARHLRHTPVSRGGVIHGFSGSQHQAEQFIRLGYAIGVGGTITYPRASKTRNTISRLPLHTLLLETDAPDMPVSGFQGQPNRPERIRHIWQTLCELRPEPPEVIAHTLLENTRRLFGIIPST